MTRPLRLFSHRKGVSIAARFLLENLRNLAGQTQWGEYILAGQNISR